MDLEIICPKCGERMVVMPDTSWSLWELHTVDAMCPNCLHLETIRMMYPKTYDSVIERIRQLG